VWTGKYWLVGHSLAYFIFGMAVVLEIVHRQLPRMSFTKAGALAYFGIYSAPSKHTNDVSGTPHFVLGYLSLMYLLLLLAYIFHERSSADVQFASVGAWAGALGSGGSRSLLDGPAHLFLPGPCVVFLWNDLWPQRAPIR
jgi:hypothetical protein